MIDDSDRGEFDHPVRAELGEQTLGGAEDAAARPHVLAGDDDAWVTAHLLGQGVANGFEDVLDGHAQLSLAWPGQRQARTARSPTLPGSNTPSSASSGWG